MITQECARIMANEGVTDFLVAKRKAAARLGMPDKRLLPANIEIERALLEYSRLFKDSTQSTQLDAQRKAAAEAMQLFACFRPRLAGSVLAGTAGPHSVVDLHLFADAPEEVMHFLFDHGIPFETTERRYRFGGCETACFPVLSFVAGEIGIDLVIFPPNEERRSPLSPIDGKPMRRADLNALRSMLGKSAAC